MIVMNNITLHNTLVESRLRHSVSVSTLQPFSQSLFNACKWSEGCSKSAVQMAHFSKVAHHSLTDAFGCANASSHNECAFNSQPIVKLVSSLVIDETE